MSIFMAGSKELWEQIRYSGSNFCISSEKDVTSKGSSLVLNTCTKTKKQVCCLIPDLIWLYTYLNLILFEIQLWYVTDKGELVLAQLLCMESPESSLQKPRLSKCHEMGGLQEWKHNDDVCKNLHSNLYQSLGLVLCSDTFLTLDRHPAIQHCCWTLSWNL